MRLRVIVGADDAEGLRGMIGGDLNWVLDAESEDAFWVDDGGITASEEDTDEASCRPGGGTDSGTDRTGGDAANRGTSGSRSDDRTGIATIGGAPGEASELGVEGDLAAIDQGEVGKGDRQLGLAFDLTSFLRLDNAARDDLTSVGYDAAVGDDRVDKRGGELVAGVVLVRRERLSGADGEVGSAGDG